MTALARLASEQERRNATLLANTPLAGRRIESQVLPFALNLAADALTPDLDATLAALEKTAATTAIKSLVSLAKANDIDHLGGGLELIPALLMTLGITDYTHHHYAIEHGHTSIGYYAALSALGFVPEARVIDWFRRSLDIAGHVSWLPGGTPIGSGRLGVQCRSQPAWPSGCKRASRRRRLRRLPLRRRRLDLRAGAERIQCGASFHKAPIAFVMHRNGIQLSGHDASDHGPGSAPDHREPRCRDSRNSHAPRPRESVQAYGEAYRRALAGRSTLIYPVGYGVTGAPVTVKAFGDMVRHRSRGRGIRGGAQGRARHADPRAGIAHEFP